MVSIFVNFFFFKLQDFTVDFLKGNDIFHLHGFYKGPFETVILPQDPGDTSGVKMQRLNNGAKRVSVQLIIT